MPSFLISLLLISVFAIVPLGPLQGKWRVHKGAYFEIKYPSSFKARPSLASNSFEGSYDSAFFTAPDGSVEFYVFSPLWNGDPKDIQIDPVNEEYVSEDTERKGNVVVRRVAIRAKDFSYRRSFEDSENTENNTRKVFGIKYRDQNAYNRYRRSYLTFKSSLRKFYDD